jgi:hypothetical protein
MRAGFGSDLASFLQLDLNPRFRVRLAVCTNQISPATNSFLAPGFLGHWRFVFTESSAPLFSSQVLLKIRSSVWLPLPT